METYQKLLEDIHTASKTAQRAEWNLLRRAKNAIEDLLQVHRLDQGEIVRLRRQVEVLQEGGKDG